MVEYLDSTISNRSIGVTCPSFLFTDCEQAAINSFALAIETYQLRNSLPFRAARQKSIYLSSSIYYVDAHIILGGEPVRIIDAFTEMAVNHYRYPPLNQWQNGTKEKVYDPSLHDAFSERIKKELRQSNYIIDNVIPSFLCNTTIIP